MQMMNFGILRGLSQSSRSIFQKSAVLGSGGSGCHEYIVKRGYAKLKKKHGIDSNRKSAKSCSSPEKIIQEKCTNDQVVNCTNEQAVSCSNYQAEEFRGEDFCGEDFCGEVFSGGDDFSGGGEFHGEDFNKEEFEGDKIFRSVEFTTHVPISSKIATGVDDFISYMYKNTHQDQDEEK